LGVELVNEYFETGCMKFLGNKYGVYADPPWLFKNYSAKGEGRNAVCHYPCMSPKELAALPVPDLAAKDCVLLLWAVDPLLPAALDLIKAWGFEFKTVGYYWAKTNRSADPDRLSKSDFSTGLGYWTRANVELCLLATRGHARQSRPGWDQLGDEAGLFDHGPVETRKRPSRQPNFP
jgi:N6-adenosine-specific RNA methylase IME4